MSMFPEDPPEALSIWKLADSINKNRKIANIIPPFDHLIMQKRRIM